MRKVVISGGPSTGKSTTFELLKSTFPDAHFIKEAAEQVIQRELAKQLIDSSYEPIMPVTKYKEFAPLVIDQQKRDEADIPPNSDLVFMDRCIIDNLGYLAYNGIQEFIPEVNSHAKVANYSVAFFCDWLGKFENTEIRRETPEQGLMVHQHLEKAYHDSGLTVVHLPPVSQEDRLEIIVNHLTR